MFGRMNSEGSWHGGGRFFGHGGRGSGGRGGRMGRHGRSRGEGADDAGLGGGRGGPFGRGGGGGRVFGPGDLRLILLSLIEEKPRHGYELIKELEEKFGGGYAPSPGSVYPTLTLLEELGYVRSSESEGTKRLFEVTAAGTRFLRENDLALKSALARMEMAARAVSGEAAPRDLHHAMHMLRTALKFHRGGWDDKETRRVTKIIEDAAEAISRRPERD
jgi:DNA-binding PadR family transcriptional regulator